MGTIDLDEAAAWIGSLPVKKAALAGLRSAAFKGVQEIVTFIIPSRSPQPVDRGVYRAGWKAVTTKNGAAIENLEPVAALIEEGVKNVKIGRKARAALAEWAVRKGIASDLAEGMRIAFAIGVMMKRRGNIFGPNGMGILRELKERRLKDIIQEEVGRSIASATRRHAKKVGAPVVKARK